MAEASALANPGRASSAMLVGPVAALLLLAVALVLWPELLGEASAGDFLLVSLVMGGGAAWLTGQAVARGWSPYSHLVPYCVLLAVAVRFCHFALFEDHMFALAPTLVEFVFLFAVASLGFRALRRRQMTAQYGWLFVRTGPFSWRTRGETDGG